MKDIWKIMPVTRLFQTTKFNFKLTNENGVKGYKWNKELKLSFQNKDSIGTLKEIINMIKVNRLSIEISIKLKNNSLVNFKM